MDDMLDRIGKVVFHSNEEIPADADWEGAHALDREYYLDHARRVLLAMREPTKAMVEAGAEGSGEDSSAVARGAWDAMIAQALGEWPPAADAAPDEPRESMATGVARLAKTQAALEVQMGPTVDLFALPKLYKQRWRAERNQQGKAVMKGNTRTSITLTGKTMYLVGFRNKALLFWEFFPAHKGQTLYFGPITLSSA